MRREIIVAILLFFLLAIPFSYNFTANIAKKNILKSLPDEIVKKLEAGEDVRVIIKFKNETRRGFLSKAAREEFESDIQASNGEILYNFKTISGAVAIINEDFIEEILFDSYIESIEEDNQVSIMLSDSIPLIGADEVWQKGITGKGISVCIIDTGINYSHPDLGGCTTEQFLNGQCSKVLSGWDFVNDDADPIDDNGHGTHVAGIVAANGSIKGVAPDVTLIAMKVLDASGSGYLSDVAAAIDMCTANKSTFNISVISMSLGTSSWHSSSTCDDAYPYLTGVINAAVGQNITVVAATGNEYNYTAISLPACIANCTKVTATDKSDRYADFANRGSGFPDILAAPGVSINSTSISGGYTIKSGTSMSTPHIAGAAALLIQAYKDSNSIEPPQSFIKNILNATGKRIYDNRTNFTFSRINISAAIGFFTEAPKIRIISPENRSYNISSILLFTEINGSETCWWEILENQSIGNVTFNCSSDVLNISDGQWTLRVWANNSYGKISNESVMFTVDTVAPMLQLFSPANASYRDAWLNYSVSDENLLQIYYVLNGTVNNLTYNEANISLNLSDGFYCIELFAIDDAGNSNSTYACFFVDTTAPYINITFKRIGVIGENVTINLTSDGMCKTNLTLPNGTSIEFEGWIIPTEIGRYEIFVLCTDDVENEANITDWFEIYEPLAVNITSNEIINLKLSIPETGEIAYEFSNNSIDTILPNRTFDAHIAMLNESIEMNMTGFRPDNLSLVIEKIENVRERIYAIEFGANYSSINVSLDFTGIGDEEHLGILYCSNWNFSSKKCISNWSDIEVIKAGKRFFVNHLSAFKIYQLPYCGDGACNGNETCSACPNDCGPCQSTVSRSYGGSGGGGYVQEKPELNITAPEYVTLLSNETVDMKIELKSNIDLNLSIQTENGCGCALEFEPEARLARFVPKTFSLKIANCSIANCSMHILFISQKINKTVSMDVHVLPVCDLGIKRCDGNVLLECNGYGWTQIGECQFGCEEGACKPIEEKEKVTITIPWLTLSLIFALVFLFLLAIYKHVKFK
ncbi:MAG: S8 family peptidase [Candidatus Aenigmatarchaeota archaeon]